MKSDSKRSHFLSLIGDFNKLLTRGADEKKSAHAKKEKERDYHQNSNQA